MNRDIYFCILNISVDIKTIIAFSSTCKLVRKLYNDNKESILNRISKITVLKMPNGSRKIRNTVNDRSIYHGVYIETQRRTLFNNYGSFPKDRTKQIEFYHNAKSVYDTYVSKCLSKIKKNGRIDVLLIDRNDFPKVNGIMFMGTYDRNTHGCFSFEYDLFNSLISRIRRDTRKYSEELTFNLDGSAKYSCNGEIYHYFQN